MAYRRAVPNQTEICGLNHMLRNRKSRGAGEYISGRDNTNMNTKSTAPSLSYSKSMDTAGGVSKASDCDKQQEPIVLSLPRRDVRLMMNESAWSDAYRREFELVIKLARGFTDASCNFLESKSTCGAVGVLTSILKDSKVSASTRQSVIRWMLKVVKSMGWSMRTFFVAVHAMDAYLALPYAPNRLFEEINDSSVPLISTAALFVGVAGEESHSQVSKAKYFVGQVPNVSCVSDIFSCMMDILKRLTAGTLMNKTPSDFIDHYLANMRDCSEYSTTFDTLVIGRQLSSVRDCLHQLSVFAYLQGYHTTIPLSRLVSLAMLLTIGSHFNSSLQTVAGATEFSERVFHLNFATQIAPNVAILYPIINEASLVEKSSSVSQGNKNVYLQSLHKPDFRTVQLFTCSSQPIPNTDIVSPRPSSSSWCHRAVAASTQLMALTRLTRSYTFIKLPCSDAKNPQRIQSHSSRRHSSDFVVDANSSINNAVASVKVSGSSVSARFSKNRRRSSNCVRFGAVNIQKAKMPADFGDSPPAVDENSVSKYSPLQNIVLA